MPALWRVSLEHASDGSLLAGLKLPATVKTATIKTEGLQAALYIEGHLLTCGSWRCRSCTMGAR